MTSIDEFLQTNLDHYLGELSELCAQPSISARHEGTRACAELVGRLLARHGLSVERYETSGNPVLVGRATGRSARASDFPTTRPPWIPPPPTITVNPGPQ